MNEHTVKVFDDELGQLRGLVAQMGGLAEEAIESAVEALVRGDLAAAVRVVEGDRRIDALEGEVERLAVQLIALRAPMADDLREVLTGMKFANTLERVADHAKNIAKRVGEIDRSVPIEPMSVLPAMATVAGEMLHDVLDAFAARDVEAAKRVCERDRAVDDLYNSIFRALVTFMMENPKSISQAAHLLFIAKNLERIGDQATNLAEMVHYAATGERMGERERVS
ncbi:phosphate transport system regulatory protein PhoU [Sphingomonas spermidinifaciens]|uniref:Phosphate-specific transport system accessory protein PhoU n=1 Tax=Sphingomonas spermidinifaciens TaxID=1141889 RepID=A0A2A4BAF9_9SPHN|nr:phosphate signaling complex protein PhoU [Sphingomonas spermidinifaciens]PCD04614.1 phosphate transport system regulatory protein PhoU [Sphingomonas spermidinifaciens]